MPRERRTPWGPLIALVLLAAVAALVVVVVRRGDGVPDGPVPVVWNKESCAHCRMAVGEPGYAAQLITAAGEVVNFDDPGCLMRYLDERHPQVHRLWFHHPREDRWLGPDAVGFLTAATTPMGWGLVAADRAAATLDLAAARAYVATRAAGAAPGGRR